MKRAAVLACVLLLAGCAAPSQTWEVVAVYTDPAVPGDVPPSAAGSAVVVFGEESLTARTGCAPLQAGATVDGDTLQLHGVDVGPVAADCPAQRVHDQLVRVLAPHAEFDIRRYGDSEMTLTLRSDELDPPTIRLVAQ